MSLRESRHNSISREDARELKTHIESRFDAAICIQLAQNTLKRASSWVVSKEGWMLPMG